MGPYINTGREIYTVRRLTSEIKNLLEERYSIVWITGEISNLSSPSSGHLYFALKDKNAMIQAVLFRGQRKNLKFIPKNGMEVTGLGRIGVYEPRGSYQIIFEYLEPKGVGALQIAFEQLKKSLASEGLFEKSRKRPLPFLPEKITIITSPTGAVIHDILNVMNRRYSGIAIDIIPVKVQGEGSEIEIARAIGLLNEIGSSDLAILARGGGSLEDLKSFNSEKVARAVFSSGIPIVSAVGHETDFTIADFVADLRAPTPSAAAELVVPEKNELVRRCASLTARLKLAMLRSLEQSRGKLKRRLNRLKNPKSRLEDFKLRLDDYSNRISRSIRIYIFRNQEKLLFCDKRLYSASPESQVKQSNVLLELNKDNLLKNMANIIIKLRTKTDNLTTRLQGLNPRAVLDRGYSITRKIPGQEVVRSPDEVARGQNLEVLVAKGSITCRVE